MGLVSLPTPRERAEKILSLMNESRPVLLLLTAVRARGAKASSSTPHERVAVDAIHAITDEGGPLDEKLEEYALSESLVYARVVFDPVRMPDLMERFEVRYLPQVRLVRRGRVLLRSAVAQDNLGEFIATDVGGRSFRRPPSSSPSSSHLLFTILDNETLRWRTGNG